MVEREKERGGGGGKGERKLKRENKRDPWMHFLNHVVLAVRTTYLNFPVSFANQMRMTRATVVT